MLNLNCSFIFLTIFFTKAVVWRCSLKKVFLKISQNSQENTCVRVSFLIKLQASGKISKNTFLTEQLRWLLLAFQSEACKSIKKETLGQVFSCEFCESSKQHLFYRTPPNDCFCFLLLVIFLWFSQVTVIFAIYTGKYLRL